ncbi:hypothetical protein [Enterobacter kobei]|uniref:hypothetical protein n=1 Tax=Enterobacter kobei TaxID=208224 RepID=UPI0035C65523
MSTITRELAKLFRKITNSEIDAEGNAHVVLSPADSLLINNARIALASLEAEAVCVIDQSNLDYLKSGSDADVWPASRTEMGDVLLYRTAPPAPVALPSGYSDFEEIWSSSTHPLTQDDEMKDFAWDIWNACRATMLKSFGNSEQLNSPGVPDCSCRTCRPITLRDMRFVVCPECGNKRCPHANDHRNACTGSNEPGQEGSAYPAAPQQE